MSVFFQLVVETVEESVRESASWVFGHNLHVHGSWFFFWRRILLKRISRAVVFLNEPLLTVAISPVRSAACTTTSLRVLAAVDRSTELKCCGPFVPRCK